MLHHNPPPLHNNQVPGWVGLLQYHPESNIANRVYLNLIHRSPWGYTDHTQFNRTEMAEHWQYTKQYWVLDQELPAANQEERIRRRKGSRMAGYASALADLSTFFHLMCQHYRNVEQYGFALASVHGAHEDAQIYVNELENYGRSKFHYLRNSDPMFNACRHMLYQDYQDFEEWWLRSRDNITSA